MSKKAKYWTVDRNSLGMLEVSIPLSMLNKLCQDRGIVPYPIIEELNKIIRDTKKEHYENDQEETESK